MKSSFSIPSSIQKYAFLCGLAIISVSCLHADASISCHNELNISLDDNCQSLVMAEDVLTHGNPPGTYTLMITTASGALVPGNMITDTYLWTTLTAKVTNSAGNSCWGQINVEDKLGPTITCSDITIACYDMNTYEPTAVDACTTSEVSVIGEVKSVIACDPNHIKEITQEYLATDSYGNTSHCHQTITLSRFDMSTIVWPIDYEIATGNNLTCKDPLNADGNPDISVTGVPTSNGITLYPYDDLYCNIAVDYRDVVIVDFGCSKKIMRTWYVYEWHCGMTTETNHVQTLEINDTELPVITNCPTSLIYDSDGSSGCDREVELQLPSATDDCSGLLEVDVTYQGGFVNNATTNPVVVLSGSTVVKYTVYDRCDNSASCQTVITIRDNQSPTAICDQNSVVSLRSDGTGLAHPGTFDDGSFDDCELYKTVVKRVDPSCGCDRPVFSDMSYLGDHNGHHYYLSDWGTTGPWTTGLATGVDAEMVSFQTAAEADWVVAAALAIEDSVYIGLSDIGHAGTFLWPDHLVPPAYTNWAPGQVDTQGAPLVAGSYVILDANGQWSIVGGGDQLRYIIEVSDPCGFSDKVDFCCTDVSAPQMVVFRAIDISGRTNDCMASVTVQDKVAPIISCPKDVTVECGTLYDPNDNVLFGTATASDQCTSNITFALNNNINPSCQVGTIQKVWTAADGNGSASCTQTFTVTSTTGYNPNAIVWPADYDVVGGCNGNAYLPADLPAANGFPQYTTAACDNVSQNYTDQVFSFAGPASDACSKIVRTWTIIDHCMPMVTGQNPQIYQQAIKVNNFIAPTINSCDELPVTTTECNPRNVAFSVTALDDCAPTTNVTGTILLDVFSDGTPEHTINSTGNIIHVSETLPVGTHTAIVSFSDRCGNTASCSKRIQVTNITAPTVTCKSSVSVNIQAMDLDSDPSTPAVNMAMVNPGVLILSTYNPCGYSLGYSFSATNPADQERIFSCSDRNTAQTLTVYVTDALGFSSSCTGTVQIQDNNNLCGMLITNQVGLSGCSDVRFQASTCPANGPLIPFDILATSSNCTSSGNFTYEAMVDYNSDGIIDFIDNGISNLGYPYSYNTLPGIHTISIVVTDECGSSASCTKEVEVVCSNTPTDPQEATLSGCDNEIFDITNCPNDFIQFSTTPSGSTCTVAGDHLVVAEIDFYNDGSTDIREDVSTSGNYTYNFPSPVGEHSAAITYTDPCGNVISCTKTFTVNCVSPSEQAIITGLVYTEEEEAVEDVEVVLDGAPVDPSMTNAEGEYAFPAMQVGGEYRISPLKNGDYLNGVSTLDLIQIQRSILGIQPLDSPYKLIAADVDKSGNVNGIDLVELRKLILGIYEELPRNTSWRMIDANHTFFNPQSPFSSTLAEDYLIYELNTDMAVDFIGVKIGDVNNSVQLGNMRRIDERSNYAFQIADVSLEAGALQEVVISASDMAGINGFQLGLQVDTDQAELVDIIPLVQNMSAANINASDIDNGIALLSWNTNSPTDKVEQLFKILLRAKNNVALSEVIKLSDDKLRSEAYVNQEATSLSFKFETQAVGTNEEIKLFQNKPNPWSSSTEITYYLPQQENVIITVYDINGKMIYQEQKRAQKGMNSIILSKEDVLLEGVLYYELIADNARYVQKMVVIE